MKKKVIVIGGGVTGMEAASCLAQNDLEVTLLEKDCCPGGHLKDWDRLFPTKRPGKEVLEHLTSQLDGKVNLMTNAGIENILPDGGVFSVFLKGGKSLSADALLLATGYDLFDAHNKEEYGYGIYDNVITSSDLEEWFIEGKEILTNDGRTPGRVGIIHCVGSRDEKAGNLYCSKVCCITGVKQAIEIREKLPETEIYNFYMDLRMYDRNFEELYMEAQLKHNVNFIRGRLSEASENADGSIVLKVEDTLTGKPLKMTVDILVLLVGFIPRQETKDITRMLGLSIGNDGFVNIGDVHTRTNQSSLPGVFVAGAVSGPKCIASSITDARAAAIQIVEYLR